MKLTSVLIGALIGLATYLTLELIFGSYGHIAYQRLEAYVAEARRDLASVQERHRDLQDRIRLLRRSAEAVRLEARDVGIVAPDEYVVRIEGREPRPRHRYMPGTIPGRIPEVRDNRPLFRSIAVAIALVYLLVDVVAHQPVRAATRRARRREERAPRGDADELQG
jgi:cell division protein FtsB